MCFFKHYIVVITGIPELRNEICKFHQIFDDISVSSEDVIVGPGSKELIFLLMNIFHGGMVLYIYESKRV